MADDRTEAAILWRIDPWIFREEGLSFMEKMLLNYVFSWSIQNRCCFSSDEWIASRSIVDFKVGLDLFPLPFQTLKMHAKAQQVQRTFFK